MISFLNICVPSESFSCDPQGSERPSPACVAKLLSYGVFLNFVVKCAKVCKCRADEGRGKRGAPVAGQARHARGADPRAAGWTLYSRCRCGCCPGMLCGLVR